MCAIVYKDRNTQCNAIKWRERERERRRQISHSRPSSTCSILSPVSTFYFAWWLHVYLRNKQNKSGSTLQGLNSHFFAVLNLFLLLLLFISYFNAAVAVSGLDSLCVLLLLLLLRLHLLRPDSANQRATHRQIAERAV